MRNLNQRMASSGSACRRAMTSGSYARGGRYQTTGLRDRQRWMEVGTREPSSPTEPDGYRSSRVVLHSRGTHPFFSSSIGRATDGEYDRSLAQEVRANQGQYVASHNTFSRALAGRDGLRGCFLMLYQPD